MSYDDTEQEDCSTPESSRYERISAVREATGLPSLTSDQRSGLRQLVERNVVVRRWHGSHADVDCPGQHLHTGKSDSTRVYIDGRVPLVHCLHQSCAEAVAEVNRELRAETLEYFGAEGIKFKSTPEEKAEMTFRKRLRLIKASARNRRLAALLKEPGIGLDAWTEASPIPVEKLPVTEHWRLHVAGLFDGDPYPDSAFSYHPPKLWIGNLHESGWLYEKTFRHPKDWLKERECPGPMICPAEFDNGYYLGNDYVHHEGQRKKVFVCHRRYIICESDTLPVEAFGNVIFYLMQFLTLRAVVHTGGKSIHCWFDKPLRYGPHKGFNALRELHAMLEGLGCDAAMFSLVATARLPGCRRVDKEGNLTDQWQRLLFLNPKYPVNL